MKLLGAISERALIQRINRYLEKEEGQLLRTSRGNSRWHHDLGRYYIIDIHKNLIVSTHQDLENLGKDLKVMSKHETLARKD